MKNLLTKIRGKRNRFNELLKQKLDNLSPAAKLNTILLVMLFYAVITCIMLINAFNENDKSINIRHIEPTSLIDTPIKRLSDKDTLLTDKLK